ncbi:MAG: hypothetical protein UDC79_08915 [Acutalibacteraceae bacterium]|nr:hypothetical protein [Oscillospiraceae bacterium]MEE0444303.1 hypothetical protein [Acutalibacteraceae bacterium]
MFLLLIQLIFHDFGKMAQFNLSRIQQVYDLLNKRFVKRNIGNLTLDFSG